MQLSSLFALLPLLALVSASNTVQPATVGVQESGEYDERASNEEVSYGMEEDDGDYHDEPETYKDEDDSDDDERDYNDRPDHRQEQPQYQAVTSKTVVIVVAKSPYSNHRATFTAGRYGGQGAAANGQVRYVSPNTGRPVSPVGGPFMLAINRVIALRINTKENDHIKKNRVYPSKTNCLTVRRRGVRNRFKARVERCNDDQRFWLRSPMSFRFEPAGQQRVYLTWMDPKGVKRCAHHDTTGTRFYPCHDRETTPTRYEILPTDYTGKFKIKQEGRNRCFDGDHNNLWMNRCRGFDDQAWDIITIAYDQY